MTLRSTNVENLFLIVLRLPGGAVKFFISGFVAQLPIWRPWTGGRQKPLPEACKSSSSVMHGHCTVFEVVGGEATLGGMRGCRFLMEFTVTLGRVAEKGTQMYTFRCQ